MSKTYVIQWKSKVNGRAGKGTKLFDLEEAEALAAELNLEYPDIHHEVLNTEPPPDGDGTTEPQPGESGGGQHCEPEPVRALAEPAVSWS